MYDIILLIFLFIFTFLIASDIAFMAMNRFLKRGDQRSAKHIFWLSRGVGPILISWLMYNLLLFFPHWPAWFYIGSILIVLIFLLFFGRKELPQLRAIYLDLFQAIRHLPDRLSSFSKLLLGLTGLIILFILVIGIGFPIVTHDSLAFGIEARIMFRDMSLKEYLDVTEPDPHTGYYLPTFQAPFLQMLYLWFFLVIGSDRIDLLLRAVAPIYALYCLILLGYVVYRQKFTLSGAIWAMFMLAVTPLFVSQSYENGQDLPRLYFAFLALIWFAELIEAEQLQKRKLALIAGIFAGFAVYSHILGAVAIVMGVLLYFILGRQQPILAKVGTIAIVSVVAFLAGAVYHYLLNPFTLQGLLKQFSLGFTYEWLILLIPDFKAPETAQVATAQYADLLETRGQGSTAFAQFIFGRLQMFTGIEYFGLLFYFFWAGVIVWLWRSAKVTLDKVLSITVLLYAVVVLSGIRKASWSNPRYIGSVLVMAAYFAGPFIASLFDRLRFQWRHVTTGLVFILILMSPLALVTTIRGAKVGITNQGTFYQDFRSFTWVNAALQHPWQSAGYMWDNYTGIKKTIQYFFASDEVKLLHAHDYYAAVLYLKAHADQKAQALVFRDGHYFYYTEQTGLMWYDPRIYPQYIQAKRKEEVYQLLSSFNINYILIDGFFEKHPAYANTKLVDLVADPDLSELVYEYSSAKVYKLAAASSPALVGQMETEVCDKQCGPKN